MLLRLLIHLGLGIDALVRRESLLAIPSFTTPFIGKFGMGTAFFAAVTLWTECATHTGFPLRQGDEQSGKMFKHQP
jgi:hypothetical protein